MTRPILDDVEFRDNPEPRFPLVLLLDTSGSMAGERIGQLNAGISQFVDEVRRDTLASLRVELLIVTFASEVKVHGNFVEALTIAPPILLASGGTDLAGGVQTAFDQAELRFHELKHKEGLRRYRPWIVMITDAMVDETPELQAAIARVHQAQRSEAKPVLFAFGVNGASETILERLTVDSHHRRMLNGAEIGPLLKKWLADSVNIVSRSRPEENGRPQEQVPIDAPPGQMIP